MTYQPLGTSVLQCHIHNFKIGHHAKYHISKYFGSYTNWFVIFISAKAYLPCEIFAPFNSHNLFNVTRLSPPPPLLCGFAIVRDQKGDVHLGWHDSMLKVRIASKLTYWPFSHHQIIPFPRLSYTLIERRRIVGQGNKKKGQ